MKCHDFDTDFVLSIFAKFFVISFFSAFDVCFFLSVLMEQEQMFIAKQ